MTFYHGTDVESARLLLRGSELDVGVATARKIDGPIGFFLASASSDAEFFACRRGPGCVLVFDISDAAVEALLAGGATIGPIARGSRSPHFVGEELHIPAGLFGAFDAFRRSAQITVRPL